MSNFSIPFLRSAFNYDSDVVSFETATSFEGQDSLTDFSQAEDADINVIVKRFGVLPPVPDNMSRPEFGDFTGISDYKHAYDTLEKASSSFMQYPAEVRAVFHNDPQRFLEFVDNPPLREVEKNP